MAKIINNKWYTDEEYDREYHEVVLWGVDILHFLMYSKLRVRR